MRRNNITSLIRNLLSGLFFPAPDHTVRHRGKHETSGQSRIPFNQFRAPSAACVHRLRNPASMRRSRAFDALTAAVRRYNDAPKTLYAHKPAQICGFSIDKCRRVPYNTIRNKSIKNIFCNLFYSCSIFTAFISTGRESLALSARGAAACGVYMGTDGFFSSGAREDRSVCRVGDRPVGLPSLPQRVDGRAERLKRRPGVGTSRCGCVFSAVSRFRLH